MSGSSEDKKEFGELDLSSLSSLNLEPSWASGDKTEKISVGRVSRERGGFRRERSGGAGGFRGGRSPKPRERGDAPSEGEDARPPRRERSGGGFGARRERERSGDGSGFDRGKKRDEGGRSRHGRAPSRHAVPAPRVAEVSFFPEEKPFGVLAAAIKNSARTYELFEIANLILEKPERFTIGVKPFARKADPAKKTEEVSAETPAPTLFLSVPDGMPFLNEADVFAYVFDRHADKFFATETVEIEPPKGNFSMVAKCGFTGELLAPPNYHAYQQILRDHHAANFPKMPFEKFMARLETVRDPESVAAWCDKMKTVVRYTVKDRKDGEPETLDGAGAAKAFLLSNRKNKVVRVASSARIPGKLLEQMPMGPMKAGIESELAFQRRFPLDTANFLRGRLRRAGFSLFKRGAKGITLVCAVRRKFRTPESVFSGTIQRIFDFLEKNPNTKIQDLPKRMLGIGDEPSVPAPTETPASAAESENAAPAQESPADVPATADAAVPAASDAEAQLSELLGSLRWLILEGYVSELSDGSLFTYPKMTAAQAKAEDAAETVPAGEAEKPDDIAAEIPPAPDVPAPAPEEISVPAESSAESAPADVPADSSPEEPAPEA